MWDYFIDTLSLAVSDFSSMDQMYSLIDLRLFILASFAGGFGLGASLVLGVVFWCRIWYGVGSFIGIILKKYRDRSNHIK